MDLRVQLTAKLEYEFFLLVLPVSKINARCSEDDVDHARSSHVRPAAANSRSRSLTVLACASCPISPSISEWFIARASDRICSNVIFDVLLA